MAKKLIFFLDFDGTISEQDVCNAMNLEFAGPAVIKINEEWERKEITTAQCAQRILELFTAGPEELRQFFSAVNIDATFPDFLNWAETNRASVYILSDGYDLYIDCILKQNGLSLPYYANKLLYDGSWRIEPLNNNRECSQCGVCKKILIEELSGNSGQTLKIYVGDGYSDICPAPVCDLIFAKDKLADFCRREGISYYPFLNFQEITVIMQDLIDYGRI